LTTVNVKPARQETCRLADETFANVLNGRTAIRDSERREIIGTDGFDTRDTKEINEECYITMQAVPLPIKLARKIMEF
jgi:hypothetical protein